MDANTKKQLEEACDACKTAASALDTAIDKVRVAHERVGAIKTFPLYATFHLWGPSVDKLDTYARDFDVVVDDLIQRARM